MKSLFPSLSDIETARLASKAILESEVEFENWDLQMALRYLTILGGKLLRSWIPPVPFRSRN